MKLLKIIKPENASKAEVKNYKIREAVRAVVTDDKKRVALLRVRKSNFYKLPGGGIKKFEDRLQALERECREKIGCGIEVTGELGQIIEYRKMHQIKQISYCYLAKVKGKKSRPSFTPEETREEFKNLWLPYKKALALLSDNKAIGIEGCSYIVPRDTIFLKTAKDFIAYQN